MTENIEAVRVWIEKHRRDYVFGSGGRMREDGMDELLALYDRTQTDVGKAETALTEQMRTLLRQGSELLMGHSTSEVCDLVRAIAMESVTGVSDLASVIAAEGVTP